VLVTSLGAAAPAGILAAVAGVALIGTFASSATAALAEPRHREAGAVTFLVAASGLSFAGVSPAFWALVAGGAVLLVTGTGVRRAGTAASQG
jgi:benzoate membrane transport protein